MKTCFLFLLIALCVLTGAAQQSGSMSGVITDSAGATVAGAVVKATNDGTDVARTVTTGESGTYSLSPLPVGTYTLEVTKQGFKAVRRTGLVVDINAAITVDFPLAIGSASEEVTVNDVPPTIDTENQEIGNLRLPEQIQNLPINVREVQTLVGQTAGVPYGTGAKTQSDTDTIGGTFSQGRASQQVLADGAQLNPFQTTGYPAIDGIGRRAELTMPNVDMIHEFRLVVNGGSAEYGNPVAILVATKAGSNKYHGDLFESYQSGGLAAKTDLLGLDPSKILPPSFVRHQFGGSMVGPIKRDKLLFAAAFEEFTHVRIDQLPARYPTDAERAGNLSSLLPAIQLYEPGTRTAIPGNRLDLDPNTPISPVSTELLKLIPAGQPAPAVGSSVNAVAAKPVNDISQKYDGRIDWNMSEKNTLFARTTVGHINQAFTYTGVAPGTYGIEVKNYYTQLFTGSFTHIFTPKLLMKSTLTHRNEPFKNYPTFGNQAFPVAIAGLNPPLPFAGPPAVTIGTNALSISNFSDRRFLNFSDDNDWQFSPSIVWTLRTHTIIAGMFFLHGNKTAAFASAPWGQFTTASDKNNKTSTTSVTGDAWADFLVGYPNSTDVTTGTSGGYLTKQNISGYIQDNWKVTPKLTLNLGVRYDNYGFFRPGDDRYANADFTNGKIIVPDDALSKVQTAFQPYLSTFETASARNLPNSLTYSNSLNFVPRIGVAYRFWNNSVLRGGFGIYNNDVNNNYLGDGINSPPFTFRARLTRALIKSNGVSENQFTFVNPTANGSTASAASTLGSFGGWTPNYAMNRAYEFNLTAEKQIGGYSFSASYAGNYQTGLSRTVDYNACVPGVTACLSRATNAADARKYTQFGVNFGANTDDGTSNYNAVIVEMAHRMHNGFSFNVNYTHARLFAQSATATNPVADPYWHYDYGPVNAQPYNVFHYNHVWELPFGRGRRYGSSMNRAVDLAVGGWKLSGVGTLQSGQPLTVTGGSGANPTGAGSNRADQSCNGRGQQPGLAGIPHSGAWFNTTCFAIPAFVNATAPTPTRQFGTSRIGSIIGPGVITYDANLQKQFRLPRESAIIFRVDVFNPFNHPLLAAPNLDPSASAATYGHTTAIVSTYQQRQVQFSGRYNF